MRAVLFLILRFYRAMKALPSLALMYATSFFGIGVSVFALVVAFALSNGFQQAYQNALLHFNAHALIFSGRSQQIEQELQQQPESQLLTVSPFVSRAGMLVAGGRIQGIEIKGERFAEEVPQRLEVQRFVTTENSVLPKVFLGNLLLQKLALQAVPQKLTVMLPEEKNNSWLPRAQEVELVGTFRSGLTEYDSQFLLTDLPNMEKFFSVAPESMTGLELTFTDPHLALLAVPRLRERFAESTVLGWNEIDPDLMQAVKLEKTVVTVIVAVMVLASSLNLASTLLLFTVLRRRSVAIMLVLGAQPRTIKASLWAWGLSLGATAIACGILFAKLLIFAINRWQLLPLDAEVYFLQAVQLDISWQTCGIVAVFSLLLMMTVLFTAVRSSLKYESLVGLMEIR